MLNYGHSLLNMLFEKVYYVWMQVCSSNIQISHWKRISLKVYRNKISLRLLKQRNLLGSHVHKLSGSNPVLWIDHETIIGCVHQITCIQKDITTHSKTIWIQTCVTMWIWLSQAHICIPGIVFVQTRLWFDVHLVTLIWFNGVVVQWVSKLCDLNFTMKPNFLKWCAYLV